MASMKLVDQEYTAAFISSLEEVIADMEKKKRLSNKDKLWREHARTFLDNPTDLNLILFTSGRHDRMQRRQV